MRSEPSLKVLSLGGGVQSTVIALMAGQGAPDRTPDCAIFADTRWEPPSVYEHGEWLSDRLSFPLYTVDSGRSLREDVKALTSHSGHRSYVDIPVYLKGRDGEGDGIGRRQCTENYKVKPIRHRIRETEAARPHRDDRRDVARHLHRGHPHEDLPEQVGEEPQPADRGGDVSGQLHGVVGEALRQAPGTLSLRRLPLPVTPSMGREERRWPELFAETVETDTRLRSGLALDKTPHLHRQRAEAVAVDEWDLAKDGQQDGFGNECGGHCGV